MFVPRVLRLKGVKEQQKPKPRKPEADGTTDESHPSAEDGLTGALEKTSTTSPAPQQEHIDHKQAVGGPRFTTTPVTQEYIAQLAAGVELIFTDYAHQHQKSKAWLQERYRVVEGQEKFVHLSAILEHPNIANLRPEATQGLLRQAIQDHVPGTLELSEHGFYVRRRPSTYPLQFVPPNSFDIVSDDGLGFWDQRTIYVEPHIRHFCHTPAKVAHWLKEHGEIRGKWLPIQAVIKLYNQCAFVVLSGSVMHGDVWQKWRKTGKPEDWIIMTKVEHAKRTEEYLELMKQHGQVPRGLRHGQAAEHTSNADNMDVDHQIMTEKKRKRQDNAQVASQAKDGDANNADGAVEDANARESPKRRA